MCHLHFIPLSNTFMIIFHIHIYKDKGYIVISLFNRIIFLLLHRIQQLEVADFYSEVSLDSARELGIRDQRDLRDTRSPRDTKDTRDTRDARDTRDTREMRDILKDSRDEPPRDSRDLKDASGKGDSVWTTPSLLRLHALESVCV